MDVRALGLAGLAERCRQETQKYRRHEDYSGEFCYEIFRRATKMKGIPAWAPGRVAFKAAPAEAKRMRSINGSPRASAAA